MILGGVFVAVIVIGIIGFIFVSKKGNALDKESKQYVDSAVPAIISKWDVKEVMDRASPEFIKTVSEEDMKKLFEWFHKLGNLKEYKGSKGDARMFFKPGQGEEISAQYVANAEFDSGPAEIKISLIKHGSKWQILGLHVNSKALMQQ